MNSQRPHSKTSDAEPCSHSTRVQELLTTGLSKSVIKVALIGLMALFLVSAPVAADRHNGTTGEDPNTDSSQLGDVFCDTDIETVINTFFSAMLGLGLPISLFYTAYSGFRYMRAGGNPDAERNAKKKLYYGVMGLLIILAVLVIPEIADKIFGTVGAGFSDCVKPF